MARSDRQLGKQKIRWYQAHSGSRRRVPINLGRVISEAPQLYLLLLLSLAEKVVTGMCEGGRDAVSALGRLAGRGRCCAGSRSLTARAAPLFSLFLAVSLLLIVAGDVETNPGPISGERKHHSTKLYPSFHKSKE